MSQQESIVNILFKRFSEDLSEEEQSLLDAWLEQSGNNRHLFERINTEEALRELMLNYREQKREASQARVLKRLQSRLFAVEQEWENEINTTITAAETEKALPKLKTSDAVTPLPPARIPYMKSFRNWGWAAAAILLLVIGSYIFTTKSPIPDTSTAMTHEIAPGQQGAILTLSDGSQVLLDSLGNGLIANQQGVQVLMQNGQLAYDATGEISQEQKYNSIITPKGRQFNVLLPDGTKVWLNAASSIRYPTVFSGADRVVQLTGEAYFEIAPNTKKPFRVQTIYNAAIEVLGTHFNINAYENEASVKTTLVEGSVRVQAGTSNHHAVILKPGQQAEILSPIAAATNTNQKGILVTMPDLDKVMAWKNNAFNFEGISLQDAMRQIERWYDIEVVYSNGIPDIKFGGKISRGVSLNGLLKILAGAKLHVQIEGRKLIILP